MQLKSSAEAELGELNGTLNSIRLKISEQKNAALSGNHAWLVEQRKRLDLKKAELLQMLNVKQDSHSNNEARVKAEFAKLKSEYYSEYALYEAELKKWNAENLNIESVRAAELNQIVNLNVGGEQISASIANLTSVEGSKL